MNFEEHAAKELILEPAGITVPRGRLCSDPDAAAAAVESLGPCVVKAQVPAGKRGKSGGIRRADTPAEAARAAREIIGMQIGEHVVKHVLVEERAEIVREFYAAVLTDGRARRPLLLFSTEGGMDVEEIAAASPGSLRRLHLDIDRGPEATELRRLLDGLDVGGAAREITDVLSRLHSAYRKRDAELIEINPLALLANGRIVALDCKFVLDDSAAYRQAEIAKAAAPEPLSELERRAREHGLKYIELDGNVGVLANGAGLTMTTMDVVRYFGGRPANFLEIGGEAYTKSKVALELVLANPRVRSLVINFCGAFARTDVMAEGVANAWQELKPDLPVFFSIHGTGEAEAIALVRERLGIEPFDQMEDAVKAAVGAAR